MGKAGSAIFAQGLLVTVADLGGSISNVMSGFIVDGMGFPAAFYVLSAVALCALGLLWFAVPETLHKETDEPVNALKPAAT